MKWRARENRVFFCLFIETALVQHTCIVARAHGTNGLRLANHLKTCIWACICLWLKVSYTNLCELWWWYLRDSATLLSSAGMILHLAVLFASLLIFHSHVQWHLSAPKLPNQTLQTHSVDNICLTRPSMILEVSTACFQIKTASASLPISSNIMMERCVSESCLCSRFVYLQRCLLRVVALNLPFLGSVLW